MVERFSDRQIDSIINEWLDSKEGSYYIDQIPIIFEGVTDGRVIFDIDEKKIFMSVDFSDGVPNEVECSSQNKKVVDFIEKCNERLVMKEIGSVKEAMSYILQQYSQVVKSKKIAYQNGDQEDDGWGPDYDENIEVQDADMEEPKYQDDEEEDWALDGDDGMTENDIYLKQIQEEYAQDNLGKLKMLGVTGTNSISLPSSVLNYKSVQMFEKSRFYKEALEAQEYLAHNETSIQGWLNLVVIKEFLNVRAEIDLNYIDLDPSNATILGWNIEEPLIITLDISEAKMLNADAKELDLLDFVEMRKNSFLQFQSINAGNTQSFGCNDYMRFIFQKFIDDELLNIDSNEEQKSSQDHLMKHENKREKKSIWKKLFSGSSSSQEKLQVNEMHLNTMLDMGFDFELSKRNLVKAHNNLEKAIEMINEEMSNVKIDIFKKEVPKTKNKLIKMMLYISRYLEQATKSCLLCHSQLLSESIKLRTCTSEHCEFTFEENFGGTIYSEIKYNTAEATLDISLAAKALFSGRAGQVFEPFPTFFLKHQEMRGKRGNLDLIKEAQQKSTQVKKTVDEKNKDTKTMTDIFAKLPQPQYLIKDVTNEQQLRQKLNDIYKNEKDGWKAYKMLSYIFATNRSTIKKLTMEERISFNTDLNQDPNFDQYILISQDLVKEKQFKERKKQHGSMFCWHGSSLENWYSILRNGLRNLSNTMLMTAGAAYGQGIYASSQFTTSAGYSMRYTNGPRYWNNIGANLNQNYAIAICEIIKIDSYKKDPNANICVIPEEDNIILRYLFVTRQQYGHQIDSLKIDFENHYYNQIKHINQQQIDKRKQRIQQAFEKYRERKENQIKELKKIQQEQTEKIEQARDDEIQEYFQKFANKISGKGSQVSLQRIQKEYSGLMKSVEFKDKLQVEFHQNNIYVWRINVDILNYEVSKELKKDFLELQQRSNSKATPKLQYEIFFSDTYPFEAPFIRVVYPRFSFRTGHVTVGGSICVQSLTPSGWSSARSLESYLVEIISLINAGEARLDLNNMHPYGLMEAKEAFNRVAKDHGWLK